MKFDSITFILFLAIIFSIYWMVRKRCIQNIILLFGSYFFYMWWDYRFSALLLFSSILDYSIGLLLQKTENRWKRKILLFVSLCVNLGLLGVFKYFNFFSDNFIALLNSIGLGANPFVVRLVLPVGISFYTFQTISYTIDVYRKKLAPTRNFIDYFAYVSFFPQLVAGPIERAGNMLPQFAAERKFNYERAVAGCRQILWGFFTKLVIADNIGVIVDRIYFDTGDQVGSQLFLATLLFGFQIYSDFSAYSHIAIGVGNLFGIRLMRNFAYPYFSQNLVEFWRRWHISLSTWFRDYLFIPLGGSRKTPARVFLNIMLVFILSGFWHGASWNFVIWGCAHGILLGTSVFFRSGKALKAGDVPGGGKLFPSPKTALKIAITFLIVTLAWTFFRSANITESFLIFRKMLYFFSSIATIKTGYVKLYWTVAHNLDTFILLLLFVTAEWIQKNRMHPMEIDSLPMLLRWFIYSLVFWITLIFAAYGNKPFIYFQF